MTQVTPMRMLPTMLMLVASLAAAPAAVADRPGGAPPALDGRFFIAQQDGPTLSEAVERVRRQCNCRIVSAETRRNGNREMHVIKVLTEDGKVRTVQVPGRSTRG